MSSFSASSYLRGLGWKGPGQGLNDSPHARSKPVTVIQKKTLAGIGKDRDEAFPWWEMVFSAVAAKTSQPSSSGSSASGVSRALSLHASLNAFADYALQLQVSKTGILSNRRPISASGSASPSTSASVLDPHSGDILGQAKVEAARRQLYRSFMRGQPIGGSNVDPEDEQVASTTMEKGKAKDERTKDEGVRESKKGKKKDKKARRREEALAVLPTPSDSEDAAVDDDEGVDKADDNEEEEASGAGTDKKRKRKSGERDRDSHRKEKRRRKKEEKLERLVKQALVQSS